MLLARGGIPFQKQKTKSLKKEALRRVQKSLDHNLFIYLLTLILPRSCLNTAFRKWNRWTPFSFIRPPFELEKFDKFHLWSPDQFFRTSTDKRHTGLRSQKLDCRLRFPTFCLSSPSEELTVRIETTPPCSQLFLDSLRKVACVKVRVSDMITPLFNAPNFNMLNHKHKPQGASITSHYFFTITLR